jgi:hypothetical protein
MHNAGSETIELTADVTNRCEWLARLTADPIHRFRSEIWRVNQGAVIKCVISS